METAAIRLRTAFQNKQTHLKYIQTCFYYHTNILFRLRDNETVALMLKTCVGLLFPHRKLIRNDNADQFWYQ